MQDINSVEDVEVIMCDKVIAFKTDKLAIGNNDPNIAVAFNDNDIYEERRLKSHKKLSTFNAIDVM